MATGEGGKVTFEDIEKVKNFIEQCMIHYVNQREIIYILHQQQKIEPSFTKIVWQILEDQNQEFFKAYYLRVIVKEQITKFNYLLEKQAAMMNHLIPNDQVPFPSMSNGSNIPPMYHVPTDLPSSSYNNGGLSGMQHASDYEVHMLLAQNANDGYILEMNNVVPVKNESNYSQNQSIDIAFVASSNNMDPNPHQLNGTPSNVISPYLLPNPDNSLDAHGTIVENQGDNKSPHNPLTNSQNFGSEEQLQSQPTQQIINSCYI